MPRMDNYPDDIRRYDHDPRSPFYNGPDERDYEDRANAMTEDWLETFPELAKQAKRLDLTLAVEIEGDADEDGPCETVYYRCNGCNIEEDENDVAAQLGRLDVESATLADEIEKIVPNPELARIRRHQAWLARKS